MRARNIKPSVFTNELLAVSDPINTLIFIGLWCIADRDGKLEDRPLRIHIEANPGRDMAGTKAAIDWLAENKFIERYAVAGVPYIRIPAFLKHQRPHQNEKPSVIPDPDGTAKVASASHQGNKHFALNPDTGYLTADSGPLNPDSLRSESVRSFRPSSSERGRTVLKNGPETEAIKAAVAVAADSFGVIR